ncbi:MAG: hypothetical protein AAF630_05110 [Cyanobacteria bacterium P01_C01_bin.38]
MQKHNLVVRASCSLDTDSAQDARTTKNKFAHLGCSLLLSIIALLHSTY